MAVNFDMERAVCDYLDRKSWKYDYHQDRHMIDCGLNIRCKLGNIRMVLIFAQNGFTSYGVCRLNAEENCRPEVMKYLTMANYNLRNGNFEIDLRDGEVRYKVYTDLTDMRYVADDVLDDCMLIPAHMFERYGNGLAALMMGFSNAEDEIAKAEADM